MALHLAYCLAYAFLFDFKAEVYKENVFDFGDEDEGGNDDDLVGVFE